MPVPALHAQGNLASVASGMRNEILTDKQDRTDGHSKLVTSSLLYPVDGGKVAPQHSNHVISTRETNGEEIMGPDMLLWCYPEKHIESGSLLIVRGNQFCVLKERDTILNVYEAGQHRVQTLDDPVFSSGQLTFDDEPITPEHRALYINRTPLRSKVSGVVLSREKTEVDYSVDYALHIASREDAVRFVQSLPSPLEQDQGLHIKDINAHVGPIVERVLNQLVQTSPLGHAGPDQEQHMQDLSQLVQERLQLFLSTYGLTVDEAKVHVTSRREYVRRPLSLRDFASSKLDAVHDYAVTNAHANNLCLKERQEEIVQNVYMIWQNRLERYADEIAALQAELERTRADIDQALDAHSAHLRKLSHAIRSELQASVPALDTREAST